MIAEFIYSVRWRADGAYPGSHPSSRWGGGHEFAGHSTFMENPQPGNIDLKASLKNPYEQLVVRRFRQRSAIPVYVVADLSASMGFSGQAGKLEFIADFSASAAFSSYRMGDPFGFIGCDLNIRNEFLIPLRLHKGGGQGLKESLMGFRPTGRSVEGLGQVVNYIGRNKALVFLVSDFHFPISQLDSLLGGLSRHDIVPVVLWDSAEYEQLPNFGLMNLSDPETGKRRRLFMRPSLSKQICQVFLERKMALTKKFSERGRVPFFARGEFDADALTKYFLS